MKRLPTVFVACIAIVMLALTVRPARAGQLGGIMKRAQQVKEAKDKLTDIEMTDDEEQQVGAAVSEKIRVRYGVVQDPAIHNYVSLVGSVLAQSSSRPALPWRFVVLDTDGVNAFAAPGGYVHITRGALSLMKNESELADVLAHEMIHVTEKHTIRAIQKGKLVQMGANETLSGNKALLGQVVDRATEVVMSGFGRADELEADGKGLVLANRAGYAPKGLGTFLTTIEERNKNVTTKQGLFASHPEMKERQDKLTSEITSQKLTASVTLDDRFRKFVTYKPVPPPSGASAEAQPQGKTIGLANLAKPGGDEKKSAEVTGSGGARGVDSERDAKGGPVSKAVSITLTAADIAAFKKEGNLS
jgi:beta-barrel assembly-enhancing protease